MLKLWIVIYNLSGGIGGTIGPLPYGMNECLERIALINKQILLEGKPIKFLCEYHEERPKDKDETI